MAVFKCKRCGGECNVADGANISKCQYCGAVNSLKKQVSVKFVAIMCLCAVLAVAVVMGIAVFIVYNRTNKTQQAGSSVSDIQEQLPHISPTPIPSPKMSLNEGEKSVYESGKINADNLVFSTTIGEINGKIYCSRLASYSIEENGTVQDHNVPTCKLLPIKTEKYPIIASFCRYNGYIYYMETEGGSSGYNTALYRCKYDGSEKTLLVDGDESCERYFHIDNNKLYYKRTSESDWYIDLSNMQIGVDAWKMYKIDEYNTYLDAVYKGNLIFSANGKIYKYDGNNYSVVTDVSGNAAKYSNNSNINITIDGMANGYIYYSYITDNSMGSLYRVPINGGPAEFIDDRMPAGGGGPYFCW